MRAVDFEHNDSRTRSKKLGAALCRRCDPLTIRPIDRARPSFDHFNCYSTILHCALNRPLIVGDIGHLLCFAGFLYSKNVKHEIKFLWPMASVSVDLLTSERERQPVSLLMLCWSGLKAHLRECFSCSNFSNLISISSLLFCTNHISMECEAGSSTLLYYISRSSYLGIKK